MRSQIVCWIAFGSLFGFAACGGEVLPRVDVKRDAGAEAGPIPVPAPPSCNDRIRNQDETGIDCGGTICGACANAQECRVDTDCTSGICSTPDHRCVGAPVITSIAPSKGGTAGGTEVTIQGLNFFGTPSISIGGVPATNVRVDSPTEVHCTTGARPGVIGLGDALLTNANGSRTLLKDAFRYYYSTVSMAPWSRLPFPFVVTGNPGAADVDGDGKVDLVFGNWSGPEELIVARNLGGGTFDASFTLASPSVAQGTPRFGDLNHDGKLDFVAGGSSSFLAVALGKGDGTFTTTWISTPPTFQVLFPDLADVDGDGNLDILCPGQNGVLLFRGRSDGTFGPPSSIAAGSGGFTVRAIDVNNDKKLDLLIARRWQGNLVDIALGNGDGTFRFPYTVVGTSDGATYDVATADFNADGVADLVFTMVSKGPSVQIALGKGDGTFLPTRSFDAGDDADRLSVADLDRDGVMDLVVSQVHQGGVAYLRGRGDGTFDPGVVLAQGTTVYGHVLADFDSDGKVDLAVTYGDVGVFRNTSR